MNSHPFSATALTRFLDEGSPRQHFLALLALWCLAILFVNPLGDFPLNDDWAYAHNTYALAQEGRWYFSDWPAMTLVAHTLWGAFFCKIFGTSFTVLRFSTLLLSMAGVWGFYRLLRWAEVGPRGAFLGALLLMFNPLWFVSAFSYMTEVPFLAVLIWAALFSLKTLETRRAGFLLTAVGLSLWACMIRQLGLLLPMVFALLFLYHHRLTLRNGLFAVLPLAVCFASVSRFEGWLRETGQLPEAYTSFGNMVNSLSFNMEMLKTTAERSGILLLTLGFFLLPLAAAAFRRDVLKRPERFGFQQVGGTLLLLFAAVALIAGWQIFPVGNVFYNFGLGAIVLKDVPMDDPALFHLSGIWLALLRCAAALGALGLCFLTWKNVRLGTERARLAKGLALGFVGAYWAFSCLNWLLFDRYVLPLLPFVVLMASPPPPRLFREGAGVGLLLALFALLGTHDYLAWNRARYAGLERLATQDVQPEQIDGGFEFNGFYRAGPMGKRSGQQKSWWFVGDDEWAVSMHENYGYDLMFAMPYRRWLPPRLDSIWVNRRKPAFMQDSLWCGMEAMTADSAEYLPEAGRMRPGNAHTRSDDRAFEGKWSARTHKGQAFALTTVLDTFQAYDRFVIRVWRYPANTVPGIVLAADDGDKFWMMETDFSPRPDSAGWRLLQLEARVPKEAVGQRGKVFVWNSSERDTVWFDNFQVLRWRVKQ